MTPIESFKFAAKLRTNLDKEGIDEAADYMVERLRL